MMKETLKDEKKVLVVDDDLFMIRVLKLKLEPAGFQVLTARNGVEGLEMFQKHKPHVVITDVNMPRMKGWELCRKINEFPGDKPEIIIVTSLIEREERRTIDEFSNVKFLDKPISPKQVLDYIQDHFKPVKDMGGQP